MIQLPTDFKEFLRLLRSNGVEYLVVGGYALGLHGYPRTTGDMDIWVATTAENAERVVRTLADFGFNENAITHERLLRPNQLVRMGVPPLCLELLTTISGVEFADCYGRRAVHRVDELDVDVISLEDLKANKKAAGRRRDLDDLANLS